MITNPHPESTLTGTESAALVSLQSRPDCDSSGPLPCPICRDDDQSYLHLVASGVQQDTVLHLICGDGVHILRGVPSSGRGSAVVTIYQGECGHRFAEVTRFCKGQSFRGIAYLGDPDELLPELWRD